MQWPQYTYFKGNTKYPVVWNTDFNWNIIWNYNINSVKAFHDSLEKWLSVPHLPGMYEGLVHSPVLETGVWGLASFITVFKCWLLFYSSQLERHAIWTGHVCLHSARLKWLSVFSPWLSWPENYCSKSGVPHYAPVGEVVD